MLLILGFDDIIKYIDLDYNDGRLAKHCLTTISQVNLYDIYNINQLSATFDRGQTYKGINKCKVG